MRRGSKRLVERILCFNRADAHDFGEALRARFPRITFRMFDYPSLQKRPEPGEAPRCDIPRYDSLGDPPESWVTVWVEPENWSPRWEGPNRENIYVVANKPRFWFVFERSEPFIPEPWRLTLGRFWAYYEEDDKEHKRFLEAVRRITGKLATNVFDVVDENTGRTIHAGVRREVWAGRHALDWCRADPRRRIHATLRPAD